MSKTLPWTLPKDVLLPDEPPAYLTEGLLGEPTLNLQIQWSIAKSCQTPSTREAPLAELQNMYHKYRSESFTKSTTKSSQPVKGTPSTSSAVEEVSREQKESEALIPFGDGYSNQMIPPGTYNEASINQDLDSQPILSTTRHRDFPVTRPSRRFTKGYEVSHDVLGHGNCLLDAAQMAATGRFGNTLVIRKKIIDSIKDHWSEDGLYYFFSDHPNFPRRGADAALFEEFTQQEHETFRDDILSQWSRDGEYLNNFHLLPLARVLGVNILIVYLNEDRAARSTDPDDRRVPAPVAPATAAQPKRTSFGVSRYECGKSQAQTIALMNKGVHYEIISKKSVDQSSEHNRPISFKPVPEPSSSSSNSLGRSLGPPSGTDGSNSIRTAADSKASQHLDSQTISSKSDTQLSKSDRVKEDPTPNITFDLNRHDNQTASGHLQVPSQSSSNLLDDDSESSSDSESYGLGTPPARDPNYMDFVRILAGGLSQVGAQIPNVGTAQKDPESSSLPSASIPLPQEQPTSPDDDITMKELSSGGTKN